MKLKKVPKKKARVKFDPRKLRVEETKDRVKQELNERFERMKGSSELEGMWTEVKKILKDAEDPYLPFFSASKPKFKKLTRQSC